MIADSPPTLPSLTLYHPHAKQWEALWALGLNPYDENPEPAHWLLLAGEGGSGKSGAARMVQCQMAERYPGGEFAVIRKYTKDITSTAVESFLADMKKLQDRTGQRLGEWNWNRLTWTWLNGARLSFHACEHDEDADRFGSYEWVGCHFEESCELTAKQITTIAGRVRAPRDRFPDWQPRILLTTVPWGPGHSYHKTTFRCADRLVPAARKIPGGMSYWTEPQEGETRLKLAWMPLELKDNPTMNFGMTRATQLMEVDPLKREAIAHGSWEQNIGGFWTGVFDPKVHIVPSILPVPAHFVVRRSYDWGTSAPFGCLWVARDPEAPTVTEYVYREYMQAGLSTQQQARLIHMLSYGDPPARMTLADPSIFPPRNKHKPVGTWRSQEFEAAVTDPATGLTLVPLTRANNKRVEGWRAIRERLTYGLYRPRPALYITEDCPQLIHWMQTVERSPADPEDIVEPTNVTDLRDELGDCLRYAVQGAAAVQPRGLPSTTYRLGGRR